MSPQSDATLSFDLQAAWLRRFSADAQSNLRLFALSLREALPQAVTIDEHRGLFSRERSITGVHVQLGDHRYSLRCDKSQLQASIAMIVRGVTLNTRTVEPGEWFRRLSEETHRASEQARSLSQSIERFMGQ